MKITEEKFASLIQTLENAPGVLERSIAASELGDCEDSRAIEPLKKCLDESHPEILCSAIKALGKLKDEGSIPRFLSFLDESYDKWIRVYAIGALCNLHYLPARTPVRQMLKDQDHLVRYEAMQGLVKLSHRKGREIKSDLVMFLEDSHETNRHLAQQWLEFIEQEERKANS